MTPEVDTTVVLFPDDVFARWRRRFPADATEDPDPRDGVPCRGDECNTLAWRGYGGLCGWCFEDAS